MCVKIKSKIAAGHNIIKFNVAKARMDESVYSILLVVTLPLRGSLSLSLCVWDFPAMPVRECEIFVLVPSLISM